MIRAFFILVLGSLNHHCSLNLASKRGKGFPEDFRIGQCKL
jgi:hypothetical protein